MYPPICNHLETNENADGRKTRYSLRRTAGAILGKDHRTNKCGRYMKASQVTICRPAGGKSYMAGVHTCGNLWTCAPCAGKIAEGRREDVADVLSAHADAGGNQWMATFTLPHAVIDHCQELRDTIAETWSYTVRGAKWKRIRDRYNVQWVRALEVTLGPSGWHPHLHVILCTRALSDDDRNRLSWWLRRTWLRAIHKARPFKTWREAKNAFKHGVHFRAATADKLDYVTKWGVDSEIAKAASKLSRAKSRGGRSPWQLLADAAEGDHLSRVRFREYADAMKGARHLTWSRGFRDLYLKRPEKTDAELAKADAPHSGHEEIGHFRKGTWLRIVKADAQADVLRAADDGGWPAVLAYLRHVKLAIPLEAWNDDGPPAKPRPISLPTS